MGTDDRPLMPEELKRLEPEPATEPEPTGERVIATAFLSGPNDLKPEVGTRLTRIDSARGVTSWQVDLTTNLRDIAASPPHFELWPVDRAKRRRIRDGDDYRPPWVRMLPSPKRVRQSKQQVLRGDQELDPLTVFPPDSRNVYFDTSFPWRCVCKVGSGSGVLIGRRLVLTASHVVDWNNPTGGTVKVHLFDDFNLGTATVIGGYVYTKVTDNSFSTIDEDYVVLVLNVPLGDQLGYLGYRTYDSSWDGKSWWFSMGYPGDKGGGDRPVSQGTFKLDEDDFDFGPGRAMSTDDGDFMPGQSGSPVFTWFHKKGSKPKVRVVGVVSAQVQNGGVNYISGGSWLSDLIHYARTHSP